MSSPLSLPYPTLDAAEWRPNRGSPRWAHVKMNGHRLFAYRDGLGVLRALTTLPTDITSQVRRYPWWSALARRLPPSCAVEGELCALTDRASDVKSLLAREDDSNLRLVAFAVPFWRGYFIPEAPLGDARSMCERLGLQFAEYSEYDPSVSYEQLARDRGIEGFVLKEANYRSWFKVKPTRTIDLVVKSFREGRGKHLGFVGAIVCETSEGHEVASVGGMSDDERYAINEQADVGRVVEVRYQCVGANGRLQHPRFVRWRDDKVPARCGTWQDEELYLWWASNASGSPRGKSSGEEQ